MGKKKPNQQDKTKTTVKTKEEEKTDVVTEPSVESSARPQGKEAPSQDPVSQLKMSLATLSKHVEAMGAVLGVPTRQKSPLPQTTDTPGPSANESNVFERPEMSQEEKQAQRKAKAAEKKARAEAAIAKKQAEEAGESRPAPQKETAASEDGNKFARPDVTQEEKKKQRADKVAAKKARTEAAIAKKSEAHDAQPSTTSEQSKDLPNGFTGPKLEGTCFKPGSTSSPPKSAIKKPKDFAEDRKVNFDLYREDTEEEILTPVEEVYNPPPSYVHNPDIHYSFYNLYVKCEKELIYEIDDLCYEFILAFRAFFRDLLGITVEQELEDKPRIVALVKEEDLGKFGAEVNKALSTQIAFLNTDGQFPLPAALGNIVKQLKREIGRMDTRDDATNVHKWIQKISHDYFEGAYDEMATHLKVKLRKAKHLVFYNCNRVMEQVLTRCKDQNLTCSVVDDKPNGRGYKFALWLAENGFKTEYSILDAAAHLMPSGSLTIFGCSSILSNGNLSGAKGTSQLCMLSQFYNLPTMCLAQSFKFVDKGTLPHKRIALLYREPDEVVASDLITAIVTDIRILPPSSAPAVLKAKALDFTA